MPWVDGKYVMPGGDEPSDMFAPLPTSSQAEDCIDPLCDECDVGRAHYANFLSRLSSLISRRTVITDEEAVCKAIRQCRDEFHGLLEPLGWLVVLDPSGNVRCTPPSIDTARPVLWLNAHLDTVDASASDFGGRDPFTCRETPSHLIGRGANDCKAGVAFMLWYAERMRAGELPRFNGGFLVTKREEAGSMLPRTAHQFAADLAAGVLPMSRVPRGTLVCCLENTVSLASHLKRDVPEVGVYDCERHSFVLRCTGTLAALGLALLGLHDHHEWKTVAAWPLAGHAASGDRAADGGDRAGGGGGGSSGGSSGVRRIEPSEVLAPRGLESTTCVRVRAQEGGHACTVRNLDNRIWHVLVRAACAHAASDAGAAAGTAASAAASDGGGDAIALPSPQGLSAWAAVQAASADAEAAADTDDEDPTALLWSGVETQPTRVAATVSTVPHSVLAAASTAAPPTEPPTGSTPAGWPHALIVNYRGLKPLADVEAQIGALRAALGAESVTWGAGTDFESGAGAQQAAYLRGSELPSALEALIRRLDGAMTMAYEPNPGRSDASHLWRSLPPELRGERVVPFTCGPGHRSHRCAAEGVMRKTHGPHEGFDKATGAVCLPFFVGLVAHFAEEGS